MDCGRVITTASGASGRIQPLPWGLWTDAAAFLVLSSPLPCFGQGASALAPGPTQHCPWRLLPESLPCLPSSLLPSTHPSSTLPGVRSAAGGPELGPRWVLQSERASQRRKGLQGEWGVTGIKAEKLQGSLQSPVSSRTLCLVSCSLEHEPQDSDHPHLFTSVSPVPHTGLTPSKCSRKEGTRAGTASSRPCPSPTSPYRAHLRSGTKLGSEGPPEAHSPVWKSHAREASALRSEKAWAGAGNGFFF